MNKQGFLGILLSVIFIWAGMLIGVSFLEAPLKFQAPGVTLPIGLGIGRLVFGALNKIEIIFCLSLILFSFLAPATKEFKYLLAVVTLILIAQTFWLLPVLDARAQVIIEGGVPAQSSPHLFYVAGEISKLLTLLLMGFRFFFQSVQLIPRG